MAWTLWRTLARPSCCLGVWEFCLSVRHAAAPVCRLRRKCLGDAVYAWLQLRRFRLAYAPRFQTTKPIPHQNERQLTCIPFVVFSYRGSLMLPKCVQLGVGIDQKSA
eukprot:1762226-Amphidinium_carterae.1